MSAQMSTDLIQPAVASAPGAAPNRVDGGDDTILVVDDDRTNLLVFSSMLRRLGFSHHVATDGRQAVDAVMRRRYAAVLMDCLMPEMDGFEATSAIRRWEQRRQSEQSRHVPIIAVTAVALKGTRERCIDAGMDDYLAKPVVIGSLEEMLDRWVRGKAPVTELMAAPAVGGSGAVDVLVDERMLQELMSLSDDGSGSFLQEVLEDFVSEVAPRFSRMRAAVSVLDDRSAREELHFIAGCAAMVGAVGVERMARSRDGLGLDDEQHMAAAMVDRLEVAFEETCTALRAMAEARA